MDERQVKAELRKRYRAKFREHGVKCEAICIADDYKRFLGDVATFRNHQCKQMAEELTTDRRPVCWVHARAAENKGRKMPLEFVAAIDGSVLPELSRP